MIVVVDVVVVDVVVVETSIKLGGCSEILLATQIITAHMRTRGGAHFREVRHSEVGLF